MWRQDTERQNGFIWQLEGATSSLVRFINKDAVMGSGHRTVSG